MFFCEFLQEYQRKFFQHLLQESLQLFLLDFFFQKILRIFTSSFSKNYSSSSSLNSWKSSCGNCSTKFFLQYSWSDLSVNSSDSCGIFSRTSFPKYFTGNPQKIFKKFISKFIAVVPPGIFSTSISTISKSSSEKFYQQFLRRFLQEIRLGNLSIFFQDFLRKCFLPRVSLIISKS